MIIDSAFLSENEINGIRSAVFSQDVPVFWTFHKNETEINHYTKSAYGNESKFNVLTNNIVNKFCNNNNIHYIDSLYSKIILVPQSSRQKKLKISEAYTIFYIVDNSDSEIIINNNEFKSSAGTAIFFDKGSSYFISSPKQTDFATMIQVAVLL